MVIEEGDIGTESSEDDLLVKGVSGAGNGRASAAIVGRPNTSPGYWLCMLLPLALASNLVHKVRCTENISTHGMLTIAAVGMCVESLCFFLYIFCKAALLQQPWSYGLFWGFVTTFSYQNSYVRVMRACPACFSFGEAAVLVQGLMLFILNVILKLPNTLFSNQIRSDFDDLNVIMMFALFYLFAVCCLLAAANILRTTVCFYPLIFLFAITVTCSPITNPIPLITLLNFILKDKARLNMIYFYIALVVLTFLAVWWETSQEGKATTRVRKIFHLLIVLVYIPGVVYQCTFLYIASGVAFAIFTILELIRVFNIPPWSITLCRAFTSFSDEKDAGVLALTPFCLLIGCSLPMWISTCPCGASDDPRILPLLSGVLSIGIGDTAASWVGSKFGRIRWPNSDKSLEGTLAFIVTTLLAILLLNLFSLISMSALKWFTAGIATLATALIEAQTDQIDNLTLPIIFYTIVNTI
ncbi:dolichol kinase isoform X2 [Rhagoletis pomonella]|uniref:dolichol kinase isoform X2 n=1 Tax=Rhagoletis pomonella TaxID=28610 RepID=UPI0017857DF2|nr:dolichol kinase isoform X2 [Rhagoletis pomonella]